MTEILKRSFGMTGTRWPIALLFYLVSLILVAFPVSVFYQNLGEAAGNRSVLNDLVSDFDFMLFSDFMREHGKVLRPALLWGLLAGFVGSLVYTFLSGGAVSAFVFQKDKLQAGRFFSHCLRLFPKYLLLLILLGLLLFSLFLVCGLFFFVFALIAEGSTERGYILWSVPPFILFAVCMTFGLTVSNYAKVFLATESRLTTVDAFWKAFSYVLKKPLSLALFWVLIGLGISLTLVYLGADKLIGMKSEMTIYVMLFFQQLLVFSRSFMKNWNYALAAVFVRKSPVSLYIPKPEPEVPAAEVPEEETAGERDASDLPE